MLFNFYKKDKIRFRSECKSCTNKRTKEWAANNRERRREIVRKSDQKYKNRRVESTVRHQENHPDRYLCQTAKSRAGKCGIPFDLVPTDITIPDRCPVFGTEFKRNTEHAMSLDRIDNSQGYVKGNVQVLSRRANAMKRDATNEELKQFADWIINNVK